jgi:hypothetical protein
LPLKTFKARLSSGHLFLHGNACKLFLRSDFPETAFAARGVDLTESLEQSNLRASPDAEVSATNTRWLNWSGFVIAVLQSACTAVIAISGIRVAIGLTALTAAAGLHTPAHGFHADVIRVPMMAVALIGSVLNLYVIWRVRRLRSRQSAQWRQKPLSSKKKRSEQLQIVLSILTLILLAAEWITHPLIHRVPLFQ